MRLAILAIGGPAALSEELLWAMQADPTNERHDTAKAEAQPESDLDASGGIPYEEVGGEQRGRNHEICCERDDVSSARQNHHFAPLEGLSESLRELAVRTEEVGQAKHIDEKDGEEQEGAAEDREQVPL
jgi:hypothetical protein